jgi:hypothetical protein
MGWRDRAAGHVVLKEADWSQLEALPKDVAFQVREHSFAKRIIWLIGTRSNVKKWNADDDPFAEFAPLGSPKFAKLAAASAPSFYGSFDTVNDFVQEHVGENGPPAFGRCKQIGELSLGVQLASLLNQKVLSLIDDEDVGSLVCISEPQRLVRIQCSILAFDLLFEKNVTTVTLATKNSKIDISPVQKSLATIEGVKIAKRILDPMRPNLFIPEQLNDFVGAKIAEAVTVFPDFRELTLIAQRASGGKVRLF